MQQTPIEKAISELDYSILFVQENQFPSESKNVELIVLNNIRRRLVGIKDTYEKKHLRDVAEKAWNECIDSVVNNSSIGHPSLGEDRFVHIDYKEIQQDKQTYLNQKHPL